MPIKSYLAHAHEGQKQNLILALRQFHQCEIVPAENEDLIVVVTDTNSKQEEEALTERINAIHSLKHLSMVSGFHSPQN